MLNITMGYIGWLLERLTNKEVADTALSSDVFALASICEVVTRRKLVKSVGSAAQMDALATAKERRDEKRMLNCNSSNGRSQRQTNDLRTAEMSTKMFRNKPNSVPPLPPIYFQPLTSDTGTETLHEVKIDDPTSHKVRMHTIIGHCAIYQARLRVKG